MGRAPIIKFNCHLVSHVYLTVLLVLVVLNILEKIYEVKNIIPHYVEWILLFWISGEGRGEAGGRVGEWTWV